MTEEIAEGRFPEKVDLGKTKEIKKLGKALEYMSREIKEGRDKLQEQVRALEEANRALIQTQKELIASEKLASLGRLSAGVAHEVGNPLSAIAGYVEVLKSRYTKLNEEKRKEFLTNIEREIERIDRIIRTLLDYARPMKFEAKRVDANELVRDTVDILKNQGAFKNTQLKIEFSSEPLPIEIDPHGVSQALINLVLNSIDATSSGGVITIGTTRLGERVEISVGDTGGGIPDEVLDKIFDPFFTTKELGKGTGLGLSISQRIVQFFGGNISVESRLGEGSVFRIRFPYRTEKNER